MFEGLAKPHVDPNVIFVIVYYFTHINLGFLLKERSEVSCFLKHFTLEIKMFGCTTKFVHTNNALEFKSSSCNYFVSPLAFVSSYIPIKSFD